MILSSSYPSYCYTYSCGWCYIPLYHCTHHRAACGRFIPVPHHCVHLGVLHQPFVSVCCCPFILVFLPFPSLLLCPGHSHTQSPSLPAQFPVLTCRHHLPPQLTPGGTAMHFIPHLPPPTTPPFYYVPNLQGWDIISRDPCLCSLVPFTHTCLHIFPTFTPPPPPYHSYLRYLPLSACCHDTHLLPVRFTLLLGFHAHTYLPAHLPVALPGAGRHTEGLPGRR